MKSIPSKEIINAKDHVSDLNNQFKRLAKLVKDKHDKLVAIIREMQLVKAREDYILLKQLDKKRIESIKELDLLIDLHTDLHRNLARASRKVIHLRQGRLITEPV